ncbi:hypothetical protein CR513_17123, partial [Mucuna pruriens]
MDVKTAFLNGDIDETIYMMQPDNFVSNESKSMASRQWYHKFYQVITSYNFETNVVDDCVYHKFSGSKYIFLVLYVDDILFASSDTCLLHETKRFMTKNFKMKDLGEASFALGIQILIDRSEGILRLSQEKYINKVLERFDMKDSKLGDTSIAKGEKFDLNGESNVRSSLYSSRYCFYGGSFGQILRSSCTLTLILLDVKIANIPRLDTSTYWLEELSLRNSYSLFDHSYRVYGLLRGIQPKFKINKFS